MAECNCPILDDSSHETSKTPRPKPTASPSSCEGVKKMQHSRKKRHRRRREPMWKVEQGADIGLNAQSHDVPYKTLKRNAATGLTLLDKNFPSLSKTGRSQTKTV